MKKVLLMAGCAMLCALATISCEKNDLKGGIFPEKQNIMFAPAMESISTKAMSEMTKVSSFKVTSTYYKDQTQQKYFENQTTVDAGDYQKLGDYFWPDWPLSFYAVYPMIDMTVNSGNVTILVGSAESKLTGTEDYVCAVSESVAKNTDPVNITFKHIFANIAEVKFNTSYAGAGTTIKIDELKIGIPRYGKYNLVTSSWSALGSSEEISLPCPETIAGKSSGTAAVDMSLIPGTYVVSVKYTVGYNGTTMQLYKKAYVTLPAGKKATIVASLKDSDDLKSFQFNVDLTPWTTFDQTINFITVS